MTHKGSIPEKVLELIAESGNNFHSKVARWFSDKGWHVTVSPYYMDQTQNKAREIDLVVEKLWPVTSSYGDLGGYLAIRLFIECKFVPSYAVFWFADKDIKAAEDLVCKETPFRKNNTLTKKHHYLNDSFKVAKLFKTYSDRNKAIENDFFYKSLNQALNAAISMSDYPFLVAPPEKTSRGILATMSFPLVVCNSFENLYYEEFYGDSRLNPLEKNFQFEVLYAYVDKKQQYRNSYFLLDFVDFNQLGDFYDAIDQDANTAAEFIRTRNFSTIRP